MEFKNEKWEVVEHSWSDTSIYNQDGKTICTLSIDDEDTTEENQEERENEVSETFNLIACAPELLETLCGLVSDVQNLIQEHDIEWQQAGYYNHAIELIKKATTI